MTDQFQQHLQSQLAGIRGAGTWKNERVIMTPQGTTVRVADGKPVLNLCANNYLGLAQHPAIGGGGAGGLGEMGLRDGVGALHLRDAGRAQAARSEIERVPRHGRHDSLRVVL
jgi:7-keto-8-aminopelargonate synthetase-like enzyme